MAVEAAWAGDVIGNLRPQALTSLMPSNARGQVRISENLRLFLSYVPSFSLFSLSPSLSFALHSRLPLVLVRLVL